MNDNSFEAYFKLEFDGKIYKLVKIKKDGSFISSSIYRNGQWVNDPYYTKLFSDPGNYSIISAEEAEECAARVAT